MDESDDYESEILFYSLNEQKRDRNRLMKRFLFLVLAVVTVFTLLILFNHIREDGDSAGGANHLRRPSIRNDPTNSSTYANVANQESQHPRLPQSCQQVNYDYLQLILRWPPAMCKFHHCQQKPDRWVIYSIKTAFYNGSFASKCCLNEDFDRSRVEVLKGLIKDKWPTLFRDQQWPASIEFEYNKYGSCIGTGLSMAGQQLHHEPLLTSTPIQLHFVDVLRRLAIWMPNFERNLKERTNIEPQTNANLTYPLTLLTKGFGLEQTINPQCSKYKINGQTYSLLDTMVICFDRYNLQQIDCPNVIDDCSESIVYAKSNIVFGV